MVKKPKIYPSRKLDQFVIRMPEGMREKLAGAAARNKRSMNAEIVSNLQEWIDRTSGDPMNKSEFDPTQSAFHSIDMIIDSAFTLQDVIKDILKKK